MMSTGAFVDMFIDVFFFKIKVGAAVIGVRANEVSKSFGSYLRYYSNTTLKLQKIAYFKCVHVFFYSYTSMVERIYFHETYAQTSQ